ncbi:uncharacterized protein LOC111372526 [Olea europaea var. sylvestris]|uniref:uncharacterized protein LOC111372526 n=1 Tax=Olea europaea var. sylvestris TaxID=158386 RepID=UPI000C1D11B3|nr:uncharacterized protein LOC111372526 [Olea europaea var. sylvestris]
MTDYLDDVGPEKWSRYHMPTNGYSIMTSNIVESINAANPVNQAMFCVSGDSSSFVVDIEQYTCTCRMLQVDRLSCPHSLAVIASMKMDPYEYCSYYYTTESYKKTYQEAIFPVGNPTEWTVPEDFREMVILTPNQKRSCGRPTEKRFRSVCEQTVVIKCERCGERSHNHRTCSNLVPLSQSQEKGKERQLMLCIDLYGLIF